MYRKYYNYYILLRVKRQVGSSPIRRTFLSDVLTICPYSRYPENIIYVRHIACTIVCLLPRWSVCRIILLSNIYTSIYRVIFFYHEPGYFSGNINIFCHIVLKKMFAHFILSFFIILYFYRRYCYNHIEFWFLRNIFIWELKRVNF